MGALVYQPKELESLLGLSRSSVYEGLRDGTIPSQRVGKRFIVSKKMIDEWLSGNYQPKQPVKEAC